MPSLIWQCPRGGTVQHATRSPRLLGRSLELPAHANGTHAKGAGSQSAVRIGAAHLRTHPSAGGAVYGPSEVLTIGSPHPVCWLRLGLRSARK